MILKTNSFLLKDTYPLPDTYGEINSKYLLPGGETGTCATVLQHLGCSVKMDGNHMGTNTYPLIRDFYSDKSVDISSLRFDEDYDGLEDYVLIDSNTRTPFGTFQRFFSDNINRWNMPSEDDIMTASVAGIDPFFREASVAAAEICHRNNIKYVTIDCPYDSILHKYASINALSEEFTGQHYPNENADDLLKKYIEYGSGLTIFTHGASDAVYADKAGKIKTFAPYKVNVVSTLGAGDTFKAGCIYALLNNMSDSETVRFACACAAIACTRFPLPLNPPGLAEIRALQG